MSNITIKERFDLALSEYEKLSQQHQLMGQELLRREGALKQLQEFMLEQEAESKEEK